MTAIADNKGKQLKVKTLTLKLPAKLPFTVARCIKGEEVDVEKLLETILGSEQAEKVWNLGLDMDEGNEVVEKIISKYGVDTGK